ncbi:MAG: protein translocase subunit SecF [Pseudoxanthomonas sp.]
MKIFPLHILPNDTTIPFMRWRKLALAATLALFVASIAIVALKGFNYALDFTGGTLIELRFQKDADVENVRRKIADAGYATVQVQNYGSARDVLVRVQPQDIGNAESVAANDKVAQDVLAAVADPGNPAALANEPTYVGPQVGKDLALNGVYATIVILIGFIAYIAFRFELKFAIAASLTALFDLLLTVAYMSAIGHEFDLTVLAGLLSVMGFAVNDIIVVFDRVRENFRSLRVEPLEVLNRSINQTLSRTIITAVMFLLSALALYLFGGSSMKGLALTHIVGAVIVVISSTFVACPLLTFGPLTVSKQDLLPKAKDLEALNRRP